VTVKRNKAGMKEQTNINMEQNSRMLGTIYRDHGIKHDCNKKHTKLSYKNKSYLKREKTCRIWEQKIDNMEQNMTAKKEIRLFAMGKIKSKRGTIL
jgi:hypothetical protein